MVVPDVDIVAVLVFDHVVSSGVDVVGLLGVEVVVFGLSVKVVVLVSCGDIGNFVAGFPALRSVDHVLRGTDLSVSWGWDVLLFDLGLLFDLLDFGDDCCRSDVPGTNILGWTNILDWTNDFGRLNWDQLGSGGSFYDWGGFDRVALKAF